MNNIEDFQKKSWRPVLVYLFTPFCQSIEGPRQTSCNFLVHRQSSEPALEDLSQQCSSFMAWYVHDSLVHFVLFLFCNCNNWPFCVVVHKEYEPHLGASLGRSGPFIQQHFVTDLTLVRVGVKAEHSTLLGVQCRSPVLRCYPETQWFLGPAEVCNRADPGARLGWKQSRLERWRVERMSLK